MQGVRVAAYFLYALGIVFGVLAIVGYLKEPRMILAHLLAGAASIVFLVSGVAYHRVAAKKYEKAI